MPGVAGAWKDLTDNVNGMANNLTDQVRNIAEVATAVASGDLTQKITVDAQGEVLELNIPSAPKNEALITRPLKELELPEDSLIGGIIRGTEVLIPDGDTVLEAEDTLLVVALPKAIPLVEKLVQ